MSNSISVLEALELTRKLFDFKPEVTYIDENRWGDHICYVTDLAKIKSDYPSWTVKKDIESIFREIAGSTKKVGA